ncbi:PR domain zinc finger protein 5 [Homalodisca vitripennis]|nr:PR domain zinc finger protein 5 [Homalodisca vitripennis]
MSHELPHIQTGRCIHPSQENCDLTCRLCRVKFEDEKTLKKHFRRCHPGRFPYQCPKCPVEFDTISVRASHVATHVDSDQDFQCFVCSIKLPTYKELYFHYSHVHVGKLDMICKYCNKIFPTRSALQEHIRVHKLGSRFTCIFCPKSFFSSQSLTVHMKRHTNKRLYKCKVCHRAFLDSSAVFQHMLFHASALVAEQPFKCCICFLGFTQKSGLKTHIGNNHSEHTTCPVCEETAEDVPEMILHILNHSIKISKNSMSKAETVWMKKSGVKKETDQESPLPKLRGQKRMSLDDNKLDGRDGKEIKLEPAEELSKYNTRRSRLVIKQEDDEDIDLGNAQEEDYSKSKQKQSRLRKPSTKYSSSTGIDTPKKPTKRIYPH